MNPLLVIGLIISSFVLVSGIAYTGVGLPTQDEPLSIRQDSVAQTSTSTSGNTGLSDGVLTSTSTSGNRFRGGSTNYGK